MLLPIFGSLLTLLFVVIGNAQEAVRCVPISHFEGNSSHGFIRHRDGTFTIFDGPGAAFTSPASINPEGAVTGSYFDASGVQHGFLRDPDGTITTFDPQGSIATAPVSINPEGISRDITLTRAARSTASCALATVP